MKMVNIKFGTPNLYFNMEMVNIKFRTSNLYFSYGPILNLLNQYKNGKNQIQNTNSIMLSNMSLYWVYWINMKMVNITFRTLTLYFSLYSCIECNESIWKWWASNLEYQLYISVMALYWMHRINMVNITFRTPTRYFCYGCFISLWESWI